MEKHVTLVGSLHIGYSAFQILGGLIAFMFIVGGGLLGGLIAKEELVFGITFFVGTTIAVWVLLVSTGIVGGVGLLRYRPWARYMVLVLSVLALLNFPIGMAIGIYSIWALVQDETAKLFASKSG
ncbi:MAG: hypothetical protein GTO63_22225 [Anaerolineae bacterium]|nr:hypothetical protein [Anaerolineae bacterium]NIN97498.1 hypothetical protein [Anaerolineae bacterium]NIQ80427.1 hypothetical protein [Anaerolineae bacterium]